MGSMNSAWCEITGSAASCGVELRTYCTAAPVLPSRSYRKNNCFVLSIEEVLRITIFFSWSKDCSVMYSCTIKFRVILIFIYTTLAVHYFPKIWSVSTYIHTSNLNATLAKIACTTACNSVRLVY